MTILYLVTSPVPQFAGTDAVLQEIAALQNAFAGEQISITPAKSPRARFPRQLFGLHCLADIRKEEARSRITHIFYPALYCFPVLRLLRNPIVFTLTAGLTRSPVPCGLEFLRGIHRIVVSSHADQQKLFGWGISRVEVIRPGIDLSRFTETCTARKPGAALRPDHGVFRLVIASAPWVERQFVEKGIDATLDAVALAPHLSLTILLRGALEAELRRRIARLGIEGRTRIVNEKVDVREYLRDADAVVLAPKRPDIIKAYPHSLLEALAAGTPVITSREIAMAGFVAELGAGAVVDEVNPQTILAAAISIARNRRSYLAGVRKFDPEMFSISRMIESYRTIYDAAARER